MEEFIPSLEHRLVHFMQGSEYEPMKQHELAGALRIHRDQRRDIRHALRALEAKGQIVRLRKNRYALPDQARMITGELSLHPDGFGFVTTAARDEEDIFIPARQTGVALHGDIVQVVITRSAGATDRPRGGRRRRRAVQEAPRGPSGRIVRVLERRHNRISGLLKVTPHHRYVIPDSSRMQQNVHVQSIAAAARTAKDNHCVVVELLDWENPRAAIPGRIVEDLGPADAPGVEMQSLIRAHGYAEEFPPQVETASRRLQPGRAVLPDEDRRDLRDELLFTIDPEDARDFDDAVSLSRLPDGNWSLGVHIADVSSYVAPDSTIDREASQRGTSVYLVDRVITMLPRHLTEDVCSLVPDAERLTHTVRMTITPRGKVESVETFPSRIRSSARLNYDQVQQLLVDGDPADLAEPVVGMLRDMGELAALLRRKRARSGSILFEMPEVRCVLDAAGTPVDIVPRESFTAYHLIEEFMLLANQSVAWQLAQRGFPTLFRIHEPPDDGQWERIGVDLGALGHVLSESTRAAINQVAARVEGKPESHIVNLAILRNLNRAMYSERRSEHFGLAFSHYLHFTSPIRRYPDLIVHRVLKAWERNEKPPYTQEELARLADHCSRMEREAADAELESVDLKRIEYYANQLEQGNIGPFPALVTGMNARGLFVELTRTLQRGMIPFGLLHQDHYQVNADRNRAVGSRTRHTWQIGDTIDVELLRVDKARKRVDFSPATARQPSRPPRRAQRKRKAK